MKKYLMQSKIILIIASFLLIILLSCEKRNIVYKVPLYKSNTNTNILVDYIKSDFLKNGGMVTEFYVNNGGNDIVLSESQGLLMEIAVYTRDKELFDLSYNFLKERMRLKSGLFSWKLNLKTNEISPSNATIDDLRIYRNLVFAEQIWGNYKTEIKSLENALKNLYHRGFISDLYDGFGSSSLFSLFYYDYIGSLFLTKNLFTFRNLLHKQNEILEKANISNLFPLYYETYDINKKIFLSINEINLLHSLLVLYNSSKAGKNIETQYNWLKSSFYKEKGLYSKYSLSGKAISNLESTAIYSYAIMIALRQEDLSFAKDLHSKRNTLLTQGKLGILLPISYKGNIIYSFDILTYVLSLLEVTYEKEI
ncbi:MAG: hypothetical protein KA384_08600 [Leptotrichiaceae bacterium]|nr:hypothetical protein [Leptotrichiaceae bacterium]